MVAAAAAVVAVAVTSASSTDAQRPPSSSSIAPPVSTLAQPALSAQGASLLPLPPGGLAMYQPDAVRATAVNVLAVAPDQGAWVGLDAQNRVWVEFTDPSDSSAEPGPVPAVVQVGRRIDFVGALSDNPADYGTTLGFDTAAQAALEAAGFHLHVDPTTVAVHQP